MKVAFLCGALEPGKDGVGDYTDRLAGELARQGHQVGLIAIHDAYVEEEIQNFAESDNVQYSRLRLPASWSPEQRFERAEKWLELFNPEWLSVQFVPFSFQKKGLIFGLKKKLTRLTQNRKCHLMFHELWVGMKDDSSWKMRIWGWVQRQLIQDLIYGLKPEVMQTQSQLYQAQLAKYKHAVGYLPLFGNIAVSQKVSIPKTRSLDANVSPLVMIHFGMIYPNAPIAIFADEVSHYAKKHQVEIILKIVGRSGNEQELWIAEWKKAGLQMELLGEQSPEIISRHMASASVGIATTAYALIEKSGSVAALREHHLRVICVSQEWRAGGMTHENIVSNIFEYKRGNFQSFIENTRDFAPAPNVADVARQFMDSLLKAEASICKKR